MFLFCSYGLGVCPGQKAVFNSIFSFRIFLPRLFFAFCSAVAGVILTVPLVAQELPPEVVDPSKVEEALEEPLLPGSEPVIITPRKPQQLSKELAGTRFTLEQMDIQGVEALDAAALKSVYEKYLGSEISVRQVFEIANDLTVLYRNEGYILSQVIVPPQKIESGHLILQAVEGFVGEVFVESESERDAAYLRRLGEKIKASKPLKAKTLERYIMLANDLPGITAQAVLQPSEIPGATDITIIASFDRFQGYGVLNNRGSRFNGPIQMQLGFEAASLLGGASSTGIRVASAGEIKEFKMVDLRHQMAIGHEGTRLEGLFRYTRSQPGAELEDLDIETEAKSARMTLVHPFVRSRAKSLYVRGGVALRDTETLILQQPSSEDRTRKAFLGMRYDFVDSLSGINLIDVEVARGLDVFNATNTVEDTQSRADAETSFTKVNLALLRLQKLTDRVNLLLEVVGQFSDDSLVASEEFAIGGATIGRVFDPASVTGDYGAAGRAELQFNKSLQQNELLDRYQLYAFADYGKAWNVVDGEDTSSDLGSVGAGLRLQFSDNLSAKAEGAYAYEKTPAFEERWGDSLRFFFSINFKF